MGNALQKVKFYIALIFVIGSISLLVYQMGIDFKNNDEVTLDDASLDYIESYEETYLDSGFDEVTTTSIENYTSDGIITTDNNTNENLVSDFFGTVQYAKSVVSKITNSLFLVYNAPNFMLVSLMLPPGPFAPIINSLGLIVFMSLVVMIIKIINIGGGD